MSTIKIAIMQALILVVSPLAFAAKGGQRAVSLDWPYAVQISSKDGMECSGAVVNDETILTAYHCFEISSEPSRLTVGFQNKQDGQFLFWKYSGYATTQKNFEVAKIYSHPKYTGHMAREASQLDVGADLAVVVIKSGGLLKFVGAKKPIIIADVQSHLQNTMTAISFGNTGGKGTAGTMKRVDIVSTGLISPNVLRATSVSPKDGLCKGDSGSGLFGHENGEQVLLGILSGVSDKSLCGKDRLKAYFVNISRGLCEIADHHGVRFDFAPFCH